MQTAVPQIPRSHRAIPISATRAVVHDIKQAQVKCATCKLQNQCLPEGLSAEGLQDVNALMSSRMRLRKGDTLFRAGDRFTSLYAIRTGSCKTVLLSEDGQEQVAGYHIPGDVIGTDGVGMDAHGCQAVALEDTEVCVLPFERLAALGRKNSDFQRNLHRLLSREIARERSVMMLLGTMDAEQRLATFLLDLSKRYRALGYSSCEFVLRMTREEIGSYLGLKLETVSRLFSRFQREGLLQVEGRVVKLLDRVSVNRLVSSSQ
jgi:CRP/FNR family transcriptional regulator, anaerobic regulatory protein